MLKCVNINHPEFKALVEQSGRDVIDLASEIAIWQELNNTDNFPELEQLVPQQNQVEYRFTSVDKILANLPKLNKWWNDKGISRDTFWKKLKDLGIPQNQIELYKESEGKTFEEVVVDTLAKYSFNVEINVSKKNSEDYKTESFIRGDWFYRKSLSNGNITFDRVKIADVNYQPWEPEFYSDIEESLTKEEYEKAIDYNLNTDYYANLTVPGGVNYQELEIKTPDITPSIQSHAQFASKNSIGWVRSDDLNEDSNIEELISRYEKQGILKIKCD